MKPLIEFLVPAGALGIVLVYIKYVAKKIKTRGYHVEFVGGPIDRESKILNTLPEVYQVTVGKDYKGNELVGIYDLDDMNVGVYTFRENSVTQKIGRR